MNEVQSKYLKEADEYNCMKQACCVKLNMLRNFWVQSTEYILTWCTLVVNTKDKCPSSQSAVYIFPNHQPVTNNVIVFCLTRL